MAEFKDGMWVDVTVDPESVRRINEATDNVLEAFVNALRKGDLVKVTGETYGQTINGIRAIYRNDFAPGQERRCMFVGWSQVQAGTIFNEEYVGNLLAPTKFVKVAVVVPVGDGKRYLAEMRVAPDQLRPIR